MDNKKRVLFVEDIDSMRGSYLANLRRENYRADGAGNLQAAIEAVDKCTYHVAIVDIMLNGPRDTGNRDGLKVLKYIQHLKEGTQTIVLSGQEDDPQLAGDAYAEYGASGYLWKKNVDAEGVSLLLKTIQRVLEKCPVDVPLTWSDLVKPIAWPVSEEAFVSECLRLLKFNGGASSLFNSLLTACKSLVPLLIQNGVERAMVFDKQHNMFTGKFWSKGQSLAIEMFLWGRNLADGTDSILAGRNILYSREKGGLSIAIADFPEMTRSDFSYPRKK